MNLIKIHFKHAMKVSNNKKGHRHRGDHSEKYSVLATTLVRNELAISKLIHYVQLLAENEIGFLFVCL